MDEQTTRKPYESDLTDEEWKVVEPLLPAGKFGGRPRTTNVREVLNAIFYLLRTGCAWRLLLHDLPPAGIVYDYSRGDLQLPDPSSFQEHGHVAVLADFEHRPHAVTASSARCS